MSEEQNIAPVPKQVEGMLDLVENKAGVLLDPSRCGKTTPHDPFVSKELVRRFKLKRGSIIRADASFDHRSPNPKVQYVHSVDGLPIHERKKLFRFDQLTTIQPKEKLNLETNAGRMTTRVIDLICPIGKGQRALIVAPPRAHANCGMAIASSCDAVMSGGHDSLIKVGSAEADWTCVRLKSQDKSSLLPEILRSQAP